MDNHGHWRRIANIFQTELMYTYLHLEKYNSLQYRTARLPLSHPMSTTRFRLQPRSGTPGPPRYNRWPHGQEPWAGTGASSHSDFDSQEAVKLFKNSLCAVFFGYFFKRSEEFGRWVPSWSKNLITFSFQSLKKFLVSVVEKKSSYLRGGLLSTPCQALLISYISGVGRERRCLATDMTHSGGTGGEISLEIV